MHYAALSDCITRAIDETPLKMRISTGTILLMFRLMKNVTTINISKGSHVQISLQSIANCENIQ